MIMECMELLNSLAFFTRPNLAGLAVLQNSRGGSKMGAWDPALATEQLNHTIPATLEGT